MATHISKKHLRPADTKASALSILWLDLLAHGGEASRHHTREEQGRPRIAKLLQEPGISTHEMSRFFVWHKLCMSPYHPCLEQGADIMSPLTGREPEYLYSIIPD